VIALVSVFWLLVAVTWGTQLHISAALSGESIGWGSHVAYGFWSSVPWIPVSLGIIYLGRRFPLRRSAWRGALAIHLCGAVATALASNALMTMSFSLSEGGPLLPAQLLRSTLAGTAAWIHVITLLYMSVVGGLSVLTYRTEMGEREVRVAKMEAELADARLVTLSAQLRPHFLLNVLHGIGQLWRSGRADDADRMLERLGDLFRGILAQTDHAEITLSEELKLVNDYLGLESIRFADRLTTSVEVEPGLESCLVPPLLLQPLVENAIRHGVGATTSAGRIVVTASRSGDRLVLEVQDDGPGPGRSTGAEEKGTGVGLENVRSRLLHLYGDEGEVQLTALPGKGALARVVLPINSQGE